jgi:hypothetical protein
MEDATMPTPWELEIHELAALKRSAARSERENIVPIRQPASEAEIVAVEKHLGLSLDLQYREFLRSSNGWGDFYIGAALFGTSELSNAALMARVAGLIDAWVEFNPNQTFPAEDFCADSAIEPRLATVSPKDVLPIGDCEFYLSIIMIGRIGSPCAGQVLHITGSAISRYRDFRAFFRHVVQVEHGANEDPNASF